LFLFVFSIITIIKRSTIRISAHETQQALNNLEKRSRNAASAQQSGKALMKRSKRSTIQKSAHETQQALNNPEKRS